MSRIYYIMIVLFAFQSNIISQVSDKIPDPKRQNFIAFGAFYGLGLPAGDISDRFGQHFLTGISIDYFNTHKKIITSLQYKYLTGTNVKEDILAPFRLENASIQSTSGGYALVLLRERGALLSLDFAKVIPMGHRYSGLKIGLGLGLLQHKIRILVDQGTVPQLENEYKKGYDRYTMGPAVKQIVGYQRIGSSRSVNYSLHFEFVQGFTKNKRPYNFDLQSVDSDSKLDILINFVAKWYIPISTYKNAEEIYY